MTDLQEARKILARIEARIVESDRAREEYEEARRHREKLQRRLAEQRQALLASL